MSIECSKNSLLRRVRTIADFQFGNGAGAAVFPDECEFQLSTTGRIRQILLGKTRLATVRAQDGRLTLGYAGASRLMPACRAPAYRVTIREDVTPFVAAGKNAMAKHIVGADPGIRAGDEVLVVGDGDTLVATGVALLGGAEMLAFNYGVAVKVRQGRDFECFQT
ncbi:pseudouridine synthase [Methanoculleus taiwanensis]|uniref:Pseudouridine synthase n=1 Tax=Methanoculleus taiwanensis TaxID=1550565 RepID=A0A498GZ49_9EURY|nr:PUA domain-containing protein [Methanoculleus taiwanensis]RXE55130.1 pseudouridine synthase [Methanoculleus taiwanensis]